jgi:hypothetical protein
VGFFFFFIFFLHIDSKNFNSIEERNMSDFLRFASVDEALQHLSDVTGNNVRIAWRDESETIMKDILSEIKKTPALMAKFKKHADKALEEGMKVRPTNKGGLVLIDEVDAKDMEGMLQEIAKAPKKEIFNIVQKEKDSFPKFSEKYSKGLQEQDGYWRAKPGLLQKGVDFLTSEKGEMSEKDEKAKEDAKKERAEKLTAIKKMALNRIKEEKIKTIDAKESMMEFIKKPGNKSIRGMFVKEFENAVESGEIDAEEAKKYETVLKSFMKRLDKDMSKAMPKFVGLIEKATQDVLADLAKAEDAPEGTEGADTGEEKPTAGKQMTLFDASDDVNGQIENIIDVWTGKVVSN